MFTSGSFSVPSMCVELRGDVGEREKPLVNLLLEEIKVAYESSEPHKNSTQVRENFQYVYISDVVIYIHSHCRIINIFHGSDLLSNFDVFESSCIYSFIYIFPMVRIVW